jgi:Aldo/keto reductase family
MDYPRLGSSGLTVSRIGLGMMSYGDPAAQPWALREDDAEPIVRHAVEAGIIYFDTADMYSGGVSEQITGRLLRRLFPSRDSYVLATKVYYPTGSGPNDRGLSRKHVLAAIDASLARLGTDHVDLYQVHRFDDQTPVEETMTALHDVVRAGKARYIGASAMYAWQLAKAQHAAATAGRTGFITMQNSRARRHPAYPARPSRPWRPARRPRCRRGRPRGRRPARPAPRPDRPRLAARQARRDSPADRRHQQTPHRRRSQRADRAARRPRGSPPGSALPAPPPQRLLLTGVAGVMTSVRGGVGARGADAGVRGGGGSWWAGVWGSGLATGDPRVEGDAGR